MSSLKSLMIDLFLVALATIAAEITRDNFEIFDAKLIALLPYLVITLGAAGVVWPALGLHRSAWQFTSMRDCLRVAASTVMVVLSAVAIGFLVNRLDGIARALASTADRACRRWRPYLSRESHHRSDPAAWRDHHARLSHIGNGSNFTGRCDQSS